MTIGIQIIYLMVYVCGVPLERREANICHRFFFYMKKIRCAHDESVGHSCRNFGLFSPENIMRSEAEYKILFFFGKCASSIEWFIGENWEYKSCQLYSLQLSAKIVAKKFHFYPRKKVASTHRVAERFLP